MELTSLSLPEARAELLKRAAAPDQWFLRRPRARARTTPIKRSLAHAPAVAERLKSAKQTRKAGKHVIAAEQYKSALEEIHASPASPLALAGEAQAGLALTSQEMGHWEQAKNAYIAAISAYQKAGTHEHAETLVSLYNNIAISCRELGQCEEAELAYVTAIEMHETHLPHEQAASLASLYGNLAYLYHDQGLSGEAFELQRFAAAMIERTTPEDHVGIVDGYRKAGVFAASSERHMEAILSFSGARQRINSEENPSPLLLCDLWISEAVSRQAIGQYDDSLRLYSHALDHLQTPAYRDDILQATLLNNVGCIQMEQGHLVQAIANFTKSIDLMRSHPAADVGVRAEVLHNLAVAYDKLDQRVAAAAFRDASRGLLQFVSDDLRLKLSHAEEEHAAIQARPHVTTERSYITYVALPLAVSTQTDKRGTSMLIPLTTETISWAPDGVAATA
jgi:tetratricopeptide (TPR) repeat protein